MNDKAATVSAQWRFENARAPNEIKLQFDFISSMQLLLSKDATTLVYHAVGKSGPVALTAMLSLAASTYKSAQWLLTMQGAPADASEWSTRYFEVQFADEVRKLKKAFKPTTKVLNESHRNAALLAEAIRAQAAELVPDPKRTAELQAAVRAQLAKGKKFMTSNKEYSETIEARGERWVCETSGMQDDETRIQELATPDALHDLLEKWHARLLRGENKHRPTPQVLWAYILTEMI
jgi:DNA-binding NarL/FixJ family response regulator